MKLKIEDNSSIVLNDLNADVEKILLYWGNIAANETINQISVGFGKPIVDTGRLRASISYMTPDFASGYINGKVKESKQEDTLNGYANEYSVVIGTNVEYAEYVHNGTNKYCGRPFLSRGIEMSSQKRYDGTIKILKGEL